MTEVKTFKNEKLGSIRIIEINEEIWFVGKDVAKALGYGEGKSLNNAVAKYVDEEDKGVTKLMTPGGNQDFIVINESGMYSLILSSKLKQAKEFKHWVTSEVLPTIRKTGKFEIRSLFETTREESKKVRNKFTDTLKSHGYTKPHEYINTTKSMKKELGITAKKDDMTLQELAAVSASEWLSMAMLTDERGYHEVNPVCIKASDTVIGAIEENRATKSLCS